MTTRKHNDFLDIPSEDEDKSDDVGYDSEVAEESKGRGRTKKRTHRAAKRRRISVNEEEESQEEEHVGDSQSEEGSEEEEVQGGGVELRADENGVQYRGKRDGKDDSDDEREGRDRDDEDGHVSRRRRALSTPSDISSHTSQKQKKEHKPLDTDKLTTKKNKTGVIYLSSLPPYLKPSALKSLLLQRGFGPITKVFLTPATPPPGASSLKKSNRRKTYTDGWVEFASKRTAKICAETLNASIVGGKKGGYYHDDVWNMKYLRGFKWSDLMEQVQRERREREAKRRIEDARARKEEKIFLSGVERGKAIEGIQKKKQEREKRRRGSSQGATTNDAGGVGLGDAEAQRIEARRLFKQNEVRTKEDRDPNALGEDTKRVLGRIF